MTQAATQFRDAADALLDVAPSLRRAGELSQSWHGPAADAFHTRLVDGLGGLDGRERELRQVARTLGRWAEALIVNQRRAEELDEQALRLRMRLRTAQDLLQDKQNARDLAATPAAVVAAAAEVASVSSLVTELESAVEEVLAKARRLEREHERVADAVADELLADTPMPTGRGPRLAPLARRTLSRGSRTASALAGLLAPAGSGPTVPPPAAGALAAAIASSGNR